MQDTLVSLLIQRDNLHQNKLVNESLISLKPGEVRLQIDRFALTANNITYAVLGDRMSYWNFFPGPEGHGKLPVWGFADVIESTCNEVSVAERIYGFFPFASQLVLQPTRADVYGFMDATPYRRDLPAVYNHYVRVVNDPGYAANMEQLQALFRPLFSTAFLLDDFLCEQRFYSADRLVLSSASSKTALGCAFQLHQNRENRRPYEIVGLTSTQNIEFVKNSGCYDRVLAYTDMEQLNSQVSTVFVDFAGNAKLRQRIHQHCGDQLQYSCMVGFSHWTEGSSGKALPGPAPVLFFAPTQAKNRLAELGRQEFARQLGSASKAFFVFVQSKINISEHSGADKGRIIFNDLLDGQIEANQGYIIDL